MGDETIDLRSCAGCGIDIPVATGHGWGRRFCLDCRPPRDPLRQVLPKNQDNDPDLVDAYTEAYRAGRLGELISSVRLGHRIEPLRVEELRCTGNPPKCEQCDGMFPYPCPFRTVDPVDGLNPG